MYYIVGGECPGRWVAYAYATSTDGVHWTDQGDMLYPLTQPGKLQSCDNPTYELGSGYELELPPRAYQLASVPARDQLAR